MNRYELESIVHPFIIESVISNRSRCSEREVNDIFSRLADYEINFARISQYSYPEGRSACTSIALIAAIKLLHAFSSNRFQITEQELDSFVLDGISAYSQLMSNQSIEHTNAAELAIFQPFSSELIHIPYSGGQESNFPGVQAIWGQNKDFYQIICHFENLIKPSQYFALVLTKPPETILLIFPPKNEFLKKYYVFDSHSRHFLLNKNSAYLASVNSLHTLIKFLEFIFPITSQDPYIKDSMMDMYNSYELNCFQLNISKQEGFQENTEQVPVPRPVIQNENYFTDANNENLDFDYKQKELIETFIETWASNYDAKAKSQIRNNLKQLINDIKKNSESTPQPGNSYQFKFEDIQEHFPSSTIYNQLSDENLGLKENNHGSKQDNQLNDENLGLKEDNHGSKQDNQLNDENLGLKEDNQLSDENQKLKENDQGLEQDNQDPKQDIRNFEEDNQKLSYIYDEIQKVNEKLQIENDSLKSQNNRLNKVIDQLKEKNQQLLNEIDELKTQINNFQNYTGDNKNVVGHFGQNKNGYIQEIQHNQEKIDTDNTNNNSGDIMNNAGISNQSKPISSQENNESTHSSFEIILKDDFGSSPNETNQNLDKGST